MRRGLEERSDVVSYVSVPVGSGQSDDGQDQDNSVLRSSSSCQDVSYIEAEGGYKSSRGDIIGKSEAIDSKTSCELTDEWITNREKV